MNSADIDSKVLYTKSLVDQLTGYQLGGPNLRRKNHRMPTQRAR